MPRTTVTRARLPMKGEGPFQKQIATWPANDQNMYDANGHHHGKYFFTLLNSRRKSQLKPNFSTQASILGFTNARDELDKFPNLGRVLERRPSTLALAT